MKVAVFYYTQTGQALCIAKSVCRPMEAAGVEVVYRAIEPVTPFPYPWSYMNFFQQMPETRLYMPAPIKDPDFTGVEDADLVMLSGQSWYLSPSQPIEAFLQNERARAFMKGRPVVTLNGCRNMWAMGQKEIRRQLASAGARYVGYIVLQDEHPNLVSLFSIVSWLFYDKKEAHGLIPYAGVTDKNIDAAERFGAPLLKALRNADFSNLQQELVALGSVPYRSFLVFVETVGHRMFGKWAKFCRKKGGPNAEERSTRIFLFSLYVFFALLVVSPIVIVIYYATYLLRIPGIKRQKKDLLFNLADK